MSKGYITSHFHPLSAEHQTLIITPSLLICNITFQSVNKFPFERDFAKLQRFLYRPKRIWPTAYTYS